jgi:hypothetical protein
MTSLSIDFEITPSMDGYQAVTKLMAKMPEYLHPGIDGEVKWREIDGGESSSYTFGWNANHPVLSITTGESAWQHNSITVTGRDSSTGTANDATQISAVGTRQRTVYDEHLDANAECAQRAQAELDLYEAGAIEGIIVCRPCHGLELYDVVTVDSPP